MAQIIFVKHSDFMSGEKEIQAFCRRWSINSSGTKYISLSLCSKIMNLWVRHSVIVLGAYISIIFLRLFRVELSFVVDPDRTVAVGAGCFSFLFCLFVKVRWNKYHCRRRRRSNYGVIKILSVQEKRNVNESLIESTVDLGILQILKNWCVFRRVYLVFLSAAIMFISHQWRGKWNVFSTSSVELVSTALYHIFHSSICQLSHISMLK